MKKVKISMVLKDALKNGADVNEIKSVIMQNFTAGEIINELINNYKLTHSKKEVKVVEKAITPITLKQEEYDKLLQFIKPKTKRNRK